MNNPVKIHKCILCGKFKNLSDLNEKFKDGTYICNNCVKLTLSGVHWYIYGKEISPCPDCVSTCKDKNWSMGHLHDMFKRIGCKTCLGKGWIFKELGENNV